MMCLKRMSLAAALTIDNRREEGGGKSGYFAVMQVEG